MYRGLIGAAFALCLLPLRGALGDDLDRQKAALQAIQEFSITICNKVSESGSMEKIEADGDISAGLNGIFKKLGELGLKGSGKFSVTEWNGIVQEQLSTAIKDNAACKERIFQSLRQMVFPNSSSGNSLPTQRGWLQPANDPTPANA